MTFAAASTTLAELKKRVMTAVGRRGINLADDEILDALNSAIADVREEAPYDVSPDETVTLAVSDWEYDISTLGFALIDRITMAASDGTFPAANEIPRWQWTVIAGTLKFDECLFEPMVRKIRIEGQKYQAAVSGDTDKVYLSASYVVNAAAGMLAGALGDLNRERFLSQKAENARYSSSLRPHPNCVIVGGA